MKVYVIFREEWDNFCYEDQDYLKDVYGVFTNMDKAKEACEELNERESFEEKGTGDNGCNASRGIKYYVTECKTDKVYCIDD